MLCKLCGGENQPVDKFCRTCGALLDAPADAPCVMPPLDAEVDPGYTFHADTSPVAFTPPVAVADPLPEEASTEPAEEDSPRPYGGHSAAVLALSVPLLFSLLAASLSLAALLAHPASPLIAVGFLLLSASLLCWLFRVGRRPGLALCCMGGVATLNGVILVLFGLFYTSGSLILPVWSPISLSDWGALRGKCFAVGFVLIVLGVLALVAALAARRRTAAPKTAAASGVLLFLAVLLLVGSTALLSSGFTAALHPKAPTVTYARSEVELALDAARERREAGDAHGAAELLRAALSIHPGDASLRGELADVLVDLGNDAAALASSDRSKAEEALSYYQEAMIYAPQNTVLSLAIRALRDMWPLS